MGKQAHKKMLNIINHEGHVNKNHKEILPPHISGYLLLKEQKITSVGANVEKLESLCIVGGNAK